MSHYFHSPIGVTETKNGLAFFDRDSEILLHEQMSVHYLDLIVEFI